MQEHIGAREKMFKRGTSTLLVQIESGASFAESDFRDDARLVPVGRIDTQHLCAEACKATLVMRPVLGEMRVAMLPALDKHFTHYTLEMEGAARSA